MYVCMYVCVYILPCTVSVLCRYLVMFCGRGNFSSVLPTEYTSSSSGSGSYRYTCSYNFSKFNDPCKHVFENLFFANNALLLPMVGIGRGS